MSGKKYVPENVFLVCNKGAKPSRLRSLTHVQGSFFGKNMCTMADKIPFLNFAPFGPCACINGMPCTAPVLFWSNTTSGISVGGNKFLLENSELPCALGGKIKIVYSMQAAFAAVPGSESFLSKAASFGKGLGKGLWTGLKGTVTGAVDLAIWAGKHTPQYAMLNPEGYAEQLMKDKQTFAAMGKAAKKAGKWAYRNSNINLLLNPEDYMKAQQENGEFFDAMMEKANNLSAEELGNFTGQVAFEALLGAATAGAGSLASAAKAADKAVDVVKVVDKLEDVAAAAKAADKAADAAKVADNVPTKQANLGDVVHKGDEVTELKGGKKGEGWSKELNGELKPNSKYLVDGYLYKTDELGRVVSVEGKLQLAERGRNTYQQGKSVLVKGGVDGDQGGHLIGDRFFGPGEQINYVPQKGSLNQGDYKKMENLWAREIESGNEVNVYIENIYEGTSKRPIGQEVKYSIGDRKYVEIFEN